MTRVKICGITDVAHVEAVAEAGADLIGVVFAPSPRQLTPEKAKAIAAAAQKQGLPAVGVFVNATAKAIRETVAAVGLRWQESSTQTEARPPGIDLSCVLLID